MTGSAQDGKMQAMPDVTMQAAWRHLIKCTAGVGIVIMVSTSRTRIHIMTCLYACIGHEQMV